MNPMIYNVSIGIGILSLFAGLWIVVGIGAALIGFGCGAIILSVLGANIRVDQ
jgi:hypothetical protein